MYKRNFKQVKKAPSAAPVFASQRRNLEQIQEKENEAASQNHQVLIGDSQEQNNKSPDIVIPSSQGASEEVQLTQSRFLSQRHQFRATQSDIQCRGKNFFEISLINGKVKIGEFGEKGFFLFCP